MTHRNLVALALGAAGLATCALAAERPVLADVTVDGSFVDWSETRTSPLNTALDEQGALVACSASADLDCPVSSLDYDLAEFAWTWNQSSVFVFARWHATSSSPRALEIYFDTDLDFDMSNNEPVVRIGVGGSAPTMELHDYRQDGSPDPIAGFGWRADGYSMPGSLVLDRPMAPAISFDSATGRLEAAIPWADLGVPAAAPLFFHVASGARPPSSPAADNMGSAGGLVGIAAWAGIRIDPDRTLSCAPGGVIQAWHRVENTGNVPARASFSATSRIGADLQVRRDLDGDGVAETYLGTDAGGDGVMTLPGDVLAPAGDSNLDGILDVGVLGYLETADLELEETCPANGAGVTEEIGVKAWLPWSSVPMDTAADVVRIGTVTVAPDVERLAARSDVAWLPHVVANNGGASTAVDLSGATASGWPVTFFEDPNRDGLPGDAVLAADSDASGLPDVRLFAGDDASILARVDVPAAASDGSRETVLVRAVLASVPQSVSTDSVVVAPPISLVTNHLAALGDARYGAAGGSIYLAHRITNARSRATVFDLVATCANGWPTLLLSDPDGDGRPYDSERLPDATGLVAANGGVFAFIVRVDVPPGSQAGDTTRLTVVATASDDPAVTAQVEDDVIAAIVRAYEDSTYTVNITRAVPCSTVHAAASGLPPSATGFRMRWLDGAGALRRSVDVATDAAGECRDSFSLSPADLGPGFRVEVQSFDGVGYVTLDVATFAVGDSVDVRDLRAAEPTYPLAGHDVDASVGVSNLSVDQPADALSLTWRVMSPDGTLVLDPSGQFSPFTGTEATLRETFDLLPGETTTRRLSVRDVTFPEAGTYRVEVWRTAGCSDMALAAAAAFSVLDDEDGDGLERSLEEASGTDAADADSDDDGVLDGDDGLGDSDSDGVVDALDCDSDGDGILDGTEAGAWSAGSWTSLAAGCFQADLWPVTTTDPDDPDTDGGGLADGREDLDRDGKRDPGESDPLDAADDTASCSSAVPPEVADVRVRREGGGVRVSWQALADPCVSYRVLVSSSLPAFADFATGLVDVACFHPGADGTPLLAFLVGADSIVSGPGPTGEP